MVYIVLKSRFKAGYFVSCTMKNEREPGPKVDPSGSEKWRASVALPFSYDHDTNHQYRNAPATP